MLAAAQAFLLVPFFLRAWGADLYGAWVALVALTSYLMLLELGGQGYMGNLLGERFARGDAAGFTKLFSEGVSLFALVGAAGATLVTVGVAIALAPGTSIIGIDVTLDVAAVILLLAAAQLLGVVGGMYNAAFRGAGLYARGVMVGNIVRLAGLVLSLGLLAVGAPPLVYALGLFAQAAVGTSVLHYFAYRAIDAVRGLRVSLANARDGWQHLRGSIYFALLSAAQGVVPQALVLVLATGAASAEVAAFSTHRTLVGLVTYVIVLLQGPLVPELTFLWGHGRADRFRALSFLGVRIGIVACGLVAAGVWLVAPAFFPLWTDGAIPVDGVLLALLLAHGTLAVAYTAATWPLISTNRHRELAKLAALSALLTVGVAAILVPIWGPRGAAAAALAADGGFGILVYPLLASRALGARASLVYRQVAAALLLVALMGGVAYTLVVVLPFGLLALALALLATLLAAAPLAAFVLRPMGVDLRVAWQSLREGQPRSTQGGRE